MFDSLLQTINPLIIKKMERSLYLLSIFFLSVINHIKMNRLCTSKYYFGTATLLFEKILYIVLFTHL